jgi:hypothetical protein
VRNHDVGKRSDLLLICVVFLIIHFSLFTFDLADPRAFLRGDRAEDRLQKIADLLAASADTLNNSVFNKGVPGDFLLHALPYWLGGQYLVIAVQMFLQFCILIATYFAAIHLIRDQKGALAAGLLLIVLPGTLIDTHTLVTETWFAALLSLGTLLLCVAIDQKNRTVPLPVLLTAFIAFAVASAIRPQGLLVPIAVALFLALALQRNRWPILLCLLLSYLIFPIAWMTLRLAFVGDFGLGASEADFGINLSIRSLRILAQWPGTPGTRVGPLEFLQIAAAHPVETLKTYAVDAVNLILNPGSNQVFGHYLRLYDSTSDSFMWLRLHDEHGFIALVTELLRLNALALTLFAIWAVIQGIVLLGIGAAFLKLVRNRNSIPLPVGLLMTVVLVSTVSVFAAGNARWTHRAGFEPLLALLAAWGLFGQKAASLAENSYCLSGTNKGDGRNSS